MTNIKSIVFDWGGVLIDQPTPGLIRYFIKHLNISDVQLLTAHRKYNDSFQKGIIDESTYWKGICKELKINPPREPSLWKRALKHVYRERHNMFNLAFVLQNNGYKTALLTNTEPPAMELFQDQHYDMFDVEVFSCAEGYRKPEHKIYEITLKRLGCKPEETLFIDDREENIKAAVSLGIQSIMYVNQRQIKAKLAPYVLKLAKK